MSPTVRPTSTRVRRSPAGCVTRRWRSRSTGPGTSWAAARGEMPSAKPIVFGSHIDSVPEGGNYDGDVGAMAAIEVAHTLAERRVVTRHPVEVAVWTNEEGGLYGSRAWSGQLTATGPGERVVERTPDRRGHPPHRRRPGSWPTCSARRATSRPTSSSTSSRAASSTPRASTSGSWRASSASASGT